MITKELQKRDKAIKAYQLIVDERDDEIISLRQQLREKEIIETGLKLDLEASDRNLEVSTQVCKSLMSHLKEIRQFWQKQLASAGLNPIGGGNQVMNNDLVMSLSNWFNSSEDLLNSASVLIPG